MQDDERLNPQELEYAELIRSRFGDDGDAWARWLEQPCPALRGEAPVAVMLQLGMLSARPLVMQVLRSMPERGGG